MSSNDSMESANPFLSKKLIKVSFLLLCLLGLTILVSLALGSRKLVWDELITGLFYPDIESYGASVVRERIPRTIFSLMCGAALGVSGTLMQAVTRNPIADPSILGVNNGAALFVVIGLSYLNINTRTQYIWVSILGAMITAILVYIIGSIGHSGATPLKLVLSGAATSAALSSLVSAIILPRSYVMDQFRFWQVGSVGSGNWESINIFLPFLLTGILLAVLSASALNSLALGDDVAKGQGVRIGVLRMVAAFAGVLLCGATTALAGPIAFVGLMAAHVMRLVLGPDLRIVIPMSALTGAIILTLADVCGRLIGGLGEVEAGIVTAFIGAPILIFLATKLKVRSL